MPIINCPQCKTSVSTDEGHCYQCGSPLEASTAENPPIYREQKSAPRAGPKIYSGDRTDYEALYERGWKWGFWLALLLFPLAGLVCLFALYDWAASDPEISMRGKGELRGAILATLLSPVILFAAALLALAVAALLNR